MISDGTGAIVATVKGLSAPEGMAYDSAKGEIFVATPGSALDLSNSVSVISDITNAVVANITVGIAPYGVAYDPAKGEVFVSNQGSDTLSVISDSGNQVPGERERGEQSGWRGLRLGQEPGLRGQRRR